MKLTNVLDFHPSLQDLKGAWEVGMTKTLEGFILEIQLFHGILESLQIGGFAAEGHSAKIFYSVLYSLSVLVF